MTSTVATAVPDAGRVKPPLLTWWPVILAVIGAALIAGRTLQTVTDLERRVTAVEAATARIEAATARIEARVGR